MVFSRAVFLFSLDCEFIFLYVISSRTKKVCPCKKKLKIIHPFSFSRLFISRIKRKNTNNMNGVICWILAIIFVAIGAYVIGLHRGYKTYVREYDKGWSDCLDWCHENYEMTEIERNYKREEKARALVEQLDDLFSEDYKE